MCTTFLGLKVRYLPNTLQPTMMDGQVAFLGLQVEKIPHNTALC